jgi:DNA-binding XRE family transcriptional regulator
MRQLFRVEVYDRAAYGADYNDMAQAVGVNRQGA